MPKYRVEAILSREYGYALIEAESLEQARSIANLMEVSEFDATAMDTDMDLLDVYEEVEG